MSIFIVTTFLAIFVAIGIYAGKRIDQSDTEGYFVAGRKLNRWQIGISAGATANSGFIVVGAVGMGYTMGLSALIYPLAWLLGDLVFWYLFAPKVRDNEAVSHSVTIPQTLTYYDSNRYLQTVAGLLILFLLSVYASSQLIASQKVVSAFMEMDADTSMLLGFAFVMAYTVWGGFKSSVWTDMLQGVMMLLLTAGVLLWGVWHIGGLGAFVTQVQTLGAGYVDLFGGRSLVALLVFVLGFAFTSFGFSMSQPQVLTRVFAAQDKQEVEAAKWIYIAFLHFTWIGMTLIGLMAKVIMPDISDAEMALPMLAKQFFDPMGIGFVFAAMLATILSSVDSMLVSASSAFSVDFGLEDKISPSKKVWLYRTTVLLTGALTLVFALYLQSTVFAIVLFAVSVMTAAIGAPMTLLILGVNKNSTALLTSLLTGLVVALVWRALGLHEIISDGFVGFIAAIVAGIVTQTINTRTS